MSNDNHFADVSKKGDTIYRQAALDEGDEWIDTFDGDGDTDIRRALRLFKGGLKRLPSAEPKKGKWNFIGDNMFECSMCGVLYTTEQLNSLRNYDTDPYLPWFCPHCGADMRGEQDGKNT